MIVDGKNIANTLLERLAELPKPNKFCAAVLVGNDAASVSFLKQKENTAKKIGVDFKIYQFPEEIKDDELRSEVEKIAADETCGGVIIQLPLPSHLNRNYILNAVPLKKDVDVLGEHALGAFYTEQSKTLPPAVGVVELICETQKYDLSSSRVAVVGLGLLVGRPIANWIMRKAKETILLRSTSDLALLKNADLVITGVGKAGLIKPEMLKAGAAVIDFGYDSMRGDFDSTGLASDNQHISFYTQTPGGTGPILVAKLFENFYRLNVS
ncbi:MAG: bifunctional 5,10-methylenetetrahydrofolate dehydrogenase/5,10-methenyltetrahydrofolate cyclohydrolase [Candidatus Kaiserbacteria bacterium]|nr:bifunctional 5,10-methylenetetrahydrofolate dehydrogenase/5,10-methenyltetrahydrofolate cyclohydrolase [Candidatus Kaiserbacteria bacterium]